MKPSVHMTRPWTKTLAPFGARLAVSGDTAICRGMGIEDVGVRVSLGTPITFDVSAGGLVLWGRPRVIRGGAGRPKVQQ